MKLNYKAYLFVFWNLVEIAAITACLVAYTSVFKMFPWYTGDSDMMLLIIIAIGNLILITFAKDYLLERTDNKNTIEQKQYTNSYKLEFDKNIYPYGLLNEELIEKLKALKKLEESGFRFDPTNK